MSTQQFYQLLIKGQNANQFCNGQFGVKPPTNPEHLMPTACCDYRGRVSACGWLQHHSDDTIGFICDDLWVIENLRTQFMPGAQLSRLEMRIEDNWYLTSLPDNRNYQLTKGTLTNTKELAISQNSWAEWCIQHKMVMLRQETVGGFTANMLNLVNTGFVDLHKGCFVGYEVIARSHNLGKVKRRLLRATCDGPPPNPGAPLFATDCPDFSKPNSAQAFAITSNIATGNMLVLSTNSSPNPQLTNAPSGNIITLIND